MAADDAVDLIGEIPQERRASILARLPAPQQAKIRGLLAYNPSTAGGLMIPDFLTFDKDITVEQVLQQIKESTVPISEIYLVDSENRLVGSTSLASLLRAVRECRIGDCLGPVAARVRVYDDFTDVAILMADYNLTAIPVVDEDDRLVGVISVDDVLESLIPRDWRRRGGTTE
jgi:Mg/Co/Ni transporter MgtE